MASSALMVHLMTWIVFLFMGSVNASEWILHTNPVMPRGNVYMAAGHWNDTIFLIGGGASSTQMMKYNITDGTFTDEGESYLESIGNSAGETGVGGYYTQMGNKLYTIGLISNKVDYIHSYRLDNLYDGNGDMYGEEGPEIPIEAGYTACLASSNLPTPRLYITGGNIGGYGQYTVQVLSIDTSEWLSGVPSMQYSRLYHACIAVDDTLYAVGLVTAIEAINITNIQSESWSTIGYLPSSPVRYMGQVVAVEEVIYVLGGHHDGVTAVDTVYAIDIVSGEVTLHSNLPNAANLMANVVVERTIYAFGGSNSGYLDSWTTYNLPTSSPTAAPSQRCDSTDIVGLNWHDMLNEEDSTTLLHGSDITFDASTLSLTFTASLEYVGLSADGNFDDDYNLGTTYWLDFQSFAESASGVDTAGTCGNRDADDYVDLDFAEWWEYTVDPLDLANAASAERMAYPDSDWTLDAASGSCSVVEYERTFSWTQMTECDDFEGNELIEITQTDDAITLSGTFFVELVSPYSMSVADHYRTYPVLQQDFAIVLNREVNTLASTGVQLFISTVMAYGRDDGGNYELTILVQSADYVMLGVDNLVTVSGPLAVNDTQTVTGDGCLVASSFTCAQIFTATIPATCSTDDDTVDLSGTYQFGFTPQCQTQDDGAVETACEVFLSTLDESAGKVILEVESSFTDNCDVDLFSVTLDGNLTFYQDGAFSAAVNEDSDPFVIGQDTIYGKVLVDIPDDEYGEMYQFVDVSIENIYVCTAEDTADIALDSDSGLGGCLSADIDADGPYTVFGEGAVTDYQGTTAHDVTANNEARFSFLTFDTPRTTINVHVQLLMTLTTESGERRRRRMLLQSDEGDAFRSYVGTTTVQDGTTTADPVGNDGAAKLSTGFIAAMVAVSAYILG